MGFDLSFVNIIEYINMLVSRFLRVLFLFFGLEVLVHTWLLLYIVHIYIWIIFKEIAKKYYVIQSIFISLIIKFNNVDGEKKMRTHMSFTFLETTDGEWIFFLMKSLFYLREWAYWNSCYGRAGIFLIKKIKFITGKSIRVNTWQ